MPDMARLLDVPRKNVYHIIKSELGKELLEVIVIADRKRVTKESFDRWYVSQTEYLKPEDQPAGVPRRHKSYIDSLTKKKVRTSKGKKEARFSDNPDYLTVDEAALQAYAKDPTHNAVADTRIRPFVQTRLCADF